MLVHWSCLTIPTTLVLAMIVSAEVKPYITTQAEVNTECKTCPRSLCPNKLNYDQQGDKFNVTCWTRGTRIMGDRLWLKSEAGCYVTQYDVWEYEAGWENDLEYCGRESEEQDLTIESNTLKYKTECRICPELSCDTIAYLKEDTDVDLTCWYPYGQQIIDDPYWLKTTNNCYVARKNLYSKPDITYLDDCGPIPLLEIEKHNNANGTSDVNKRAFASNPQSSSHHAAAPALVNRSTMYLVNVTVGEEYAPCRSCARPSCAIEKTYEFNQEVWLQCVTNANKTGASEWWSETADFCYVRNTDFWESPEGDFYRMPTCERFEEPGISPDDERE